MLLCRGWYLMLQGVSCPPFCLPVPEDVMLQAARHLTLLSVLGLLRSGHHSYSIDDFNILMAQPVLIPAPTSYP
jgi:hypothetical protein